MITLITGGPGTGKTAWLIDQLLDLRKNEPNRDFYIHGIRNLRGLSHEQIFCRSQLCDICRVQDDHIKILQAPKFVEDWDKWKSSGDLIVVDEVQRIWKPRTGSALKPTSVSGLETHRHYGVDFWIISQGPNLFDVAVRSLVGRHVHLVGRWSGRKQYEWPECKQDISSRSDAVTRPYKLPKRVYAMYDSAEVHTSQDKRKPLAFYGAVGLAVLASFLIVFVGLRIKSRFSVQEQAVVVSKGGGESSPATFGASSNKQSDKVDLSSPEKLETAMTPVVVGLPWTAPIYKELAKPVSMPVVVGCIKSTKKDDHRCACYTQQATIVDMPADVCSMYVQHHAFNHFKPDHDKNVQDQVQSKSFVASNDKFSDISVSQ
jgi:zona occludens toxin